MHGATEGIVRVLWKIVTDEEGPCTSSAEGLDDGCFFCGAYPIIYVDDVRTARHKAGCPWVEGRRLFGLEIAPHTIEVA